MGFKEIIFNTKMSVTKHKSDILLGFGISSIVLGVIAACKETLELPDILEEHKQLREKIVSKEENAQEHRCMTYKLYCRTGFRLFWNYLPSFVAEIVGLGLVLKGYGDVKVENGALAANLAAVTGAFGDYRDRVKKRFGDEVDYQLAHGIEEEEVEEIEVDEKGKEKKVKKKKQIADPKATGSGYSKYFTRSNPYWSDDEDQVKWFFRGRQSELNDRLKSIDGLGREGYVTLNEAYEACGFCKEQKGMIVGWVNDPSHPCSDGYIEITVKPTTIRNERGEEEDAYIVDFNVDGNIFDRVA